MSTASRVAEERFSLGRGVVADPVRNQIIREGRAIAIEPRVMELLVYLAQRPGEVVSKPRLIEQVWRAHVVDEAVHRAVSLLRSALADSPSQPALIETVPRRGYRLLVEPKIIAGRSALVRRWFAPAAAVAIAVAALAVVGLEQGQQTPSGSTGMPAAIAQPAQRAQAVAATLSAPVREPATKTRTQKISSERRSAARIAEPESSAPEAPAAESAAEARDPPTPTPRAVEAPRADAPPAPSARR